jgi:hypothetical protein
LVDYEYVLAHRGKQGQGYVYELLYDGDLDHHKHLTGLIDVENLRKANTTTTTSRGKDTHFTGCLRPGSGPKTGAVRGEENTVIPSTDNELGEDEAETGKKGHIRPQNNTESYRSHIPAMSAKGR